MKILIQILVAVQVQAVLAKVQMMINKKNIKVILKNKKNKDQEVEVYKNKDEYKYYKIIN